MMMMMMMMVVVVMMRVIGEDENDEDWNDFEGSMKSIMMGMIWMKIWLTTRMMTEG